MATSRESNSHREKSEYKSMDTRTIQVTFYLLFIFIFIEYYMLTKQLS